MPRFLVQQEVKAVVVYEVDASGYKAAGDEAVRRMLGGSWPEEFRLIPNTDDPRQIVPAEEIS